MSLYKSTYLYIKYIVNVYFIINILQNIMIVTVIDLFHHNPF